MSDYTLKVRVEDVEPGMYVVELDRPWTETPFLFQGFYVNNQNDIDALTRYCTHVYVQSTGGKSIENPPGGGKKPHAAGGKNGSVRPEHEALRDELRLARKHYEEATRHVIHIMNQLRGGGKLNASLAQSTVDQIVDNVIRIPDAMMWLNRMKRADEYTYNHSVSSSVWSVIFGRHLGLDRRELITVGLGGMLMDVGKTRVRSEVLTKPAPLTAEEYEDARRHLEHGVRILNSHKDIGPGVLEMVKTHHERHDGTGYPRGLKGNQIPVFGRMAAIVDSYDAMISRRPYAPPMSSYDAMRDLNKLANAAFQGEMVEQFIQAIGVFPTGTLVELNTGEVAVVVSQNQSRRLRPRIMLILGADKRLRSDFPVIDLLRTAVDAEGRQSIWIARGLEPGSHGIDPIEFFL